MEEFLIECGYKDVKKLRSGAFGHVFQVIDYKAKKEIAIKLEDIDAKHPQVKYEFKVYRHLAKGRSVAHTGIPQAHYAKIKGKYNIMTMDLLGLDLEKLFNLCNRKFSLKTVLMIADQMLSIIELVHNKDILHRDIKPDNFVIGKDENQDKIYIIDFGLFKRYVNRGGKHIACETRLSLTGTARYASLYAHLSNQGRRDDLESIGYVLLYFLLGRLPWQNAKGNTQLEKNQNIFLMKKDFDLKDLCKGLPDEFVTYLQYCRGLKFEEKPDYTYLRNLFRNLLIKSGFEFDYEYDWTILNKKKDVDKKEELYINDVVTKKLKTEIIVITD